jgi:hypothetical protein
MSHSEIRSEGCLQETLSRGPLVSHPEAQHHSFLKKSIPKIKTPKKNIQQQVFAGGHPPNY